MSHATVLRLSLAIFTSITLAACGGSYEADSGFHQDYIPPAETVIVVEVVEVIEVIEVVDNYPIDASTMLYSANIFDSYGTNSEFEDTPLALSPFIDDGLFEVFWDIESYTDYTVDVLINDNPDDLSNAVTISSEYCGEGLACDTYQYQYCAYTADFFVSCETPSGSLQGASINEFMPVFPNTVYLTVRACDANFFHCSSESLPVTME
ncbi:MAG: hypothetical protein COA42_21070 [Alteromonadaceae bacterium]|nr:MAG: hypothetical protein COA42_21070 [Alteromonadaceae bacterium]